MALSMKPEHLRRYKDVARLLLKYGRGDLVRAVEAEHGLLGDELEETESGELAGNAQELAAELEALGPTFVKLGQILSSRSDLLPVPYLEALSRLQDHVEPFPFEQVERIVSEELGVRLSKAFAEFDAVPLAAASLAQVHRAKLRDGREVVVKVQRPDIRETVMDDLESFGEIAEFLDHHTETGRRLAFGDMMDEFRRSLLRELDFRLEAQNLSHLRHSLKDYPRIVVPEPIDGYSTSRVLTMDYVRGTKVTELPAIARTELDGAALAGDLARAYLDGILIEGFFHADPHPGNVMLTDDHRIGVVDLGMVGRVDERMQEHLLKLVLAIADGKGHEVAQIAMQLGKRLEEFDERRFTREIADLVHTFYDSSLADLNLGRVILELARRTAESGMRPASELTLVGKTLLHLDEVSRALDPSFDPTSTIRSHADSLMRRHMLKSLSPGNIFSSLLDLNEFVQELPARLNRLFEAVLHNELELRFQVIDERLLMDNLQKIANRIALAMVLAALIVGAALMMRIQTSFTLFGYPGLAMLLFMAAAACGFLLVGSILYFDIWKERGWRGGRGRE